MLRLNLLLNQIYLSIIVSLFHPFIRYIHVYIRVIYVINTFYKTRFTRFSYSNQRFK
nr:MAG TPA: hypothetical protein [Caudoviricetes sp.]